MKLNSNQPTFKKQPVPTKQSTNEAQGKKVDNKNIEFVSQSAPSQKNNAPDASLKAQALQGQAQILITSTTRVQVSREDQIQQLFEHWNDQERMIPYSVRETVLDSLQPDANPSFHHTINALCTLGYIYPNERDALASINPLPAGVSGLGGYPRTANLLNRANALGITESSVTNRLVAAGDLGGYYFQNEITKLVNEGSLTTRQGNQLRSAYL